MLMKFLFGLVLVLGIFAGVAYMQPDDMRVERTATIAAPAAAIFENINNLKKWNAWSPWAKLDPNAKNSFEGPEAGTGAKMSWAGNFNVGEGSMTIEESRAAAFVKFKLDFIKPLAGSNTAEFTLKPDGANTTITWAMYGKKSYPAKVMGLIFNCEKMLGEQFDEGLAALKAVVETK